MQDYFFSLDLNSTPIFIINSVANLIADNFKIFLSNNKLEFIDLKRMINNVKQNDLQNMFRIFVVFNYILENIQIGRSMFNYFTYKKMLNSFKYECLQEIFDFMNEMLYQFIGG